jgi:predicted GNAT superfamily acetyltransferase
VAGAGVDLPSFPDHRAVVVRIPRDYASLLAGDPIMARAWRHGARRAFQHYLSRGYAVSAFVADPRGDASYVLSHTAR